jgi:Ca2+-binding EF-hand superfamily protein
MSALLAAQGQSSTGTTTSASTSQSNALKDLFSQIDANGDGQLSKSEFENALGAGGTNLAQADDVFSKLDTNGDGSVSLGEMSSALKGSGAAGHAHHHHANVASTGDSSASNGDASGSNADPLMQALAGASSTSVTNSDGSTTTSLTYADGSKVTMTSPAATTASSTATSSYNLIEQMIQRESQAISFSAANPSLSLSA